MIIIWQYKWFPRMVKKKWLIISINW
jgi:hypothetical protein